jgi:hypothetical protein
LKFTTEQLKICLQGVIVCKGNEASCAKPVVFLLEVLKVPGLKASDVDCHLFTASALYCFISTISVTKLAGLMRKVQ